MVSLEFSPAAKDVHERLPSDRKRSSEKRPAKDRHSRIGGRIRVCRAFLRLYLRAVSAASHVVRIYNSLCQVETGWNRLKHNRRPAVDLIAAVAISGVSQFDMVTQPQRGMPITLL